MTDINLEIIYKTMDAPIDLTELMERLTSATVINQSAEALPLLIYIISRCLSEQTGSPVIKAKEIAEKYNIVAPTATHWNRRLKKHGLVTYKRDKGGLRYTPAEFINPAGIFRNYIVDEVRDRSSAMFGDLFARVRALELKTET